MKQAHAVKDENQLYDSSSEAKPWDYEYRPYDAGVEEKQEPYVVFMQVVPGPPVSYVPGSVCCPLVNADMFKDAEQDRHEWTRMLNQAAVRVDTLHESAKQFLSSCVKNSRKRTIAGTATVCFLNSGYTEQSFAAPTDFTGLGGLGRLLDGATSIFCYDAENDYALLKCLQTDLDFVSGRPTTDEKEARVGRYQTGFFPEQRIYHWRLKTNDLRSEWSKHKNRDCSLRTLFHYHDIRYDNELHAIRRAAYETHAWGHVWRDISHCENVEDDSVDK